MKLDSIKIKLQQDYKSLHWLILLLAGLLASWAVFQEHGRINDDGVIYLEAARVIALGEWKQSLGLYPWPLYPALIATIHQITGLSLQHAALLLSVMFFLLATHIFMLLIKETGGNRRTVVAGILLLLSCTYIMRYNLPTVMREQGHWAFYLASLLYFIRFYRAGRQTDALAWQLCILLAMLFRIETITFVALLPLVILRQQEISWPQRGKRLLQAYSLSITAALAVLMILLIAPAYKLSDLGRLHEPISVLQGAYQQITHGLIDKAHIIGESVLGSFLSDYGMQGLLLTLIAVIIGKISASSGWLALILAAVLPKIDAPKPASDAKRILLWAAGLGLLNLWVILLCNFILPSRLAFPIAWVVFIFAAFTLSSIYNKWQQSKHGALRINWLAWIVAIALVLQFAVTLKPRPAHYNDEQEAVAWIKQHAPSESQVFYDNARFRYYANLPFVDRGIADWDRVTKAIGDGSIQRYDYLVIHMNNSKPEREKYLQQVLPHHLVATINSAKDRRILIFALNAQAPR